MQDLPKWMNILFIDGGKADLEELRNRWFLQGDSPWTIRRKTVFWLWGNIWSKLVNFVSDLVESVKNVLPNTYPYFENLEEPFTQNYSKNAINTARVSLVTAIFLYAIFGFLDIYCLPSSRETVWIIRYGLVCPVFCLALIMLFFPRFNRFFQLTMSLASLIAGYGIIMMIFLAQKSEIAYSSYYAGLILVIIYLYTISRIRLKNAIGVGFLIIIGYEYIAISFQKILATEEGIAIFLNNNFFFFSATILGILSCSLIEKSSKDEFIIKSLIVEEVFQEVRHYFGLYAPEDDQELHQLLNFLAKKPRNLDEMLSNYYLYKISKVM